ncbi:MAG TPA: CotH kinase family protein, partial [Chthoniobacteraceae bacterium]|nr:CotH kinase family protein [Chthoniobacteraceae bacterium]
IFGGSSVDRWKSDKLSMNFSFWADLSTGVLGDSAIGSYDTLVLDARLNQVWNHSQDATQRNRGDFVRDAVMSDLQNAVGSYGPHSQHVHVYINGLYWGVYTLHEKPEEHFAAEYLGGDSDDYDVVKHAPSHPGYLVAGRVINPALPVSNTNHTAGVNYQALLNLANADLTVQANYDALAAKLDVDDLIKYMLINFYGGNTDWAHQNWYASYNRVRPDGRWRYHSWDAEHVFKVVGEDVTTKDDPTGPTHIHQRLALNSEYRRIFGDAAHKLLYNGGTFTPARGKAIFDARLMDINEAIRAESARWGDSGPSTATAPTTELHLRFSNVTNGGTFISWWNERLRILNTILDGATNRTTVLLSQLRSRSLYPSFDAPVFSQHGGLVAANYPLTMTNPGGAGTIHYTLDGSDPRVPFTGAISPTAQPYSGAVVLPMSRTVRARVRNGTSWSALNEAHFSVATVAAAAGKLVISKIHYRPAAPTPAEIAAGYDERSDFEFIEILNISNERVYLGGISFSAGLDIAPISGGVTELGPGERALYVAKKEAFEFRYGTGLPIAGEFVLGSNLDNDGETLTLLASNNTVIVSLTYNDVAPWPLAPDGTGPSLVLMNPTTSDPNVATNWRQSTAANGAPAADDRLLYAAWQAIHFPGGGPDALALADPEGDGIRNQVEFGLGTDPNAPTPASALPVAVPQLIQVGVDPAQWFLTFTYRRVKAAEELTWTAETSSDLVTWSASAADIVLVGTPVDHGDGTESRTYRATQPIAAEALRYFRAKVTKP